MCKRSKGGRVAAMAWLCLVVLAIGGAEVGAQTLPAPWSSRDIGAPALAGSVTYNQGTFSIDGAGTDIWDLSDQFRFVYQQVSGDVDVIARVDSVTQASVWSKAGVMIRASLAANSAHGLTLVSAAKGIAFQRRTTTGGLTTSTAGPFVAPPHFVRIVRLGTKVYSYTSVDGVTWSQIGSDTLPLGSTAYVGLAVTSHNATAATTATVSQVAVIPLSLPAPQKSVDIGAPALASNVLYRLGQYDIRAAGADIWGTYDQFNYIYQPVSGDFEVAARVDSIVKTSGWAKAGVMVRETLTPNSRHAFALLSAADGFAFQRRIDPGGYSFDTGGGAGVFPGWVKLVRTGTLFEAFRSTDGTSWIAMGSEVIPMVDPVYVGIATTSHNTTIATDALVEKFSLVPRGGVTNQPPLVSITSPSGGATFTAGTNITVTAAASDSDGTIGRVDFYAGTTLIGSDSSAPYSATWPSAQAGTYTLSAVAVDNAGARTTSASVGITVTAAVNRPPSVTLTSPANGASYTAPAGVLLAASASDSDGTIARVQLYAGTTLLATLTSAPYSYTWSNVAAGTYAIHAVAYDNSGASASSATSTITVAGPPLGVTFQASADHATLVIRYELRIFASGAAPATATPIAVSDLGKPTPDAVGDITVDRSTFFASLPAGSYVAAVAAVGSAGWTISAGVSFTR